MVRATSADRKQQQEAMVTRQMAARGIADEAVLEAMRSVPREAFVPEDLAEYAYADSPLPIGEGQTISQPYIVALMAEALELEPDDRVMEIGTGSGYAAAVLAEIADEVYTVERHGTLADKARELFDALGYDNVHVRHGDGSLGWPEHAPYDAIVVAAGGPEVPQPLKEQLAVGGRLVIPVGRVSRLQKLLLVRRTGEESYATEELGAVQFVPLVGAAGWGEQEPGATPASPARPRAEEEKRPREDVSLPELIASTAEPVETIAGVDLTSLLERIGDARVVLLGEATHGTAEFYAMRAQITQALIEEKEFNIVAAEADWPDAARIDQYIRDTPVKEVSEAPFSRFPSWMWANAEFLRLVEWLRDYNRNQQDSSQQIGFYGLDLYSLNNSMGAVIGYLEERDPDLADIARQRYGCLSPWEHDPAAHGAAAVTKRYQECEEEVVQVLQDMLDKALQYTLNDGERYFNALQNARVVGNAEKYYRIMYYGSPQSWNLRDRHMFDTLESLLAFRGPQSRAVVWAHNSHLGNAAATEMAARGQINIGQLCRDRWGTKAYLIGFGTDHGTVAAASSWDGPMEIKEVRPAHEQSYEYLCHQTSEGGSGLDAFLLPLRTADTTPLLRRRLMPERLERAIGVIYRPETELQSHYFNAVLPRQFDEYIWFDETTAVTPLKETGDTEGVPETFPFGV
ncbi:MAG: protein-L-isoaspartate(D-aspartate) O-methyltransferase [Candidatus Promineifilaceae bacterium]|nr:protein-L-isoaspartate(D-aspartate) O-methyltransferase [Candidatus Promineifilaceae bacterium]